MQKPFAWASKNRWQVGCGLWTLVCWLLIWMICPWPQANKEMRLVSTEKKMREGEKHGRETLENSPISMLELQWWFYWVWVMSHLTFTMDDPIDYWCHYTHREMKKLKLKRLDYTLTQCQIPSFERNFPQRPLTNWFLSMIPYSINSFPLIISLPIKIAILWMCKKACCLIFVIISLLLFYCFIACITFIF